MNKLLENIKNIKDDSLLLMGHVVAGFPDYETSLKAAKGICRGNASFLEVQFPFSDPNADGPVIENACYKSIEAGFKVEDGFNIVKELSSCTDTAIIIMTYANIIYKYGIGKFIKKAVESGCSALIVPDLPLESDEKLLKTAEENGIGVILIAAPGCDGERIRTLSKKSFGLLYTVARRGITGSRTDITGKTKEWIKLVNDNSSKPVALGFGIQSKDQTDKLKGIVPIVVAGSYFVNIISELEKNADIETELINAVKKLGV